MGLGGQRHAPAALPPGKTRYPLYWASGPVWTGAENLAPTGIRSPDRPARSESLYRLRILSLCVFFVFKKFCTLFTTNFSAFGDCCTDLFIVGTSQFRELIGVLNWKLSAVMVTTLPVPVYHEHGVSNCIFQIESPTM
jgi:hypothetical protein